MASTPNDVAHATWLKRRRRWSGDVCGGQFFELGDVLVGDLPRSGLATFHLLVSLAY